MILLKFLMPVFHNKNNQRDMPKVIASDLLKHVNNLKNKTYVLHGQMKGKTNLPIPAGAEKVTDKDIQLAEK